MKVEFEIDDSIWSAFTRACETLGSKPERILRAFITTVVIYPSTHPEETDRIMNEIPVEFREQIDSVIKYAQRDEI